MLTSFWEKAGEGLAGLWNSKILTPVAVFWGGALLAWTYQNGVDRLAQALQAVDATLGVVLLIGLLVLLTLSAEFARRMVYPVLRWAQGYWPGCLAWLRSGATQRKTITYNILYKEWESLDETFDEKKGLNPDQANRYVELGLLLSAYPLNENLRMPTGLGNRLRAAEEYPQQRYGLEADLIWPRLWLVLPAETRQELAAARQNLNEVTQIFFWGILFVIWVCFSLWVIVPTIVVCWIAWWQMNVAAERYSQLFCATFDLYRFDLYKSLMWPVPKKPTEEHAAGVALSQYLRHNKAPQSLEFTTKETEKTR